MTQFFILVSFLYGAAGFAAVDAKRTVDLSQQQSKIEFLAIGKPSLIKIHGTGGALKGKIESENGLINGKFLVSLEPITTGIGLRDEHMKAKYLEVSKYPEAELTLSALKLQEDPFTKKALLKDIPFSGKIKIHGVEKEAAGVLDVDSSGKTVDITAKTRTTISAHEISLPSYMGIKVADEVEIFVDLKIKK